MTFHKVQSQFRIEPEPFIIHQLMHFKLPYRAVYLMCKPLRETAAAWIQFSSRFLWIPSRLWFAAVAAENADRIKYRNGDVHGEKKEKAPKKQKKTGYV